MLNKMQSLPEMFFLISRVVKLKRIPELNKIWWNGKTSYQPQVFLQWVNCPNLTAEGCHGECVNADVGGKVEVHEIVLILGWEYNFILKSILFGHMFCTLWPQKTEYCNSWTTYCTLIPWDILFSPVECTLNTSARSSVTLSSLCSESVRGSSVHMGIFKTEELISTKSVNASLAASYLSRSLLYRQNFPDWILHAILLIYRKSPQCCLVLLAAKVF